MHMAEELRKIDAETGDWLTALAELQLHMGMMCAVCEGEGLADLMDAHPKEQWKLLTDMGLNFNTDKDFEPYVLNSTVLTPAVRSAYIKTFTALRKWRAEGHPDFDYLIPTLTLPGVPPAPIMPEFNDNLFRSYQAAGWRTNYDAQKASPTAGLTPGVYRAWCVRNLLALLDDRNLTGITGFQDILDVNVAFRLPEFMAAQFNRIHAVHNPFLAQFGLSSFMQILSGGNVLTVRRDVFLTDGATVVSNGGSWVDTAERDRRLDLVDADSGRRNRSRLTSTGQPHWGLLHM